MPDWTLLPIKTDLSIYKKFNFERSPVAINYCFYKPEGFEKLDKPCGLCEMVKACQEKGEPFYITAEEEDCVGKMFLGQRKRCITRTADGWVSTLAPSRGRRPTSGIGPSVPTWCLARYITYSTRRWIK
jgi:hypothetical protein